VSFAFAQNWSIHVAYASRQAEYPPPIFDISSKTAVARAVAERDTFDVVALRAADCAVAARTTLDAAARPTVAWAADTVFEDVDVRGVTALRAETFADAPPGTLITDCVLVTVVVGRRVAERDADAPDTALPPADDDAARRTSRPSLRALAGAGDDATDVPRGLGAWAAKP